ncbi:MAG: acetyl-coenzyme A synthetase, partial [Hyphomicrobiales bacterium]|nr:acetyl-coenzyme A synthetase [Hyphomicrobiales bacterium]
MSETVHPVPAEWAARAYVDHAKYDEMYAQSVADPEGFWAEQAERLEWIKPFTVVKNTSFDAPNVSINWFEDGVLNVAANCVDRHLETRADQTA